MNIVLIGPPGAGKGTQSDKIANFFKLQKISTGALLRNEISKKTNLGNKIKSIIEKGSLVSDEITNNLIIRILSDKNFFNRLIFDGYPRNLDQAKNLDILLKKHDQRISCVFTLKVDKELLIKRILGRQTCCKCGLIFNDYYKPATDQNHACGNRFLVKRSDDNKNTILQRYETYLEKTLPIINYYKKLKLHHELDGKAEINQIFEKISQIIASLEG